jgi:two-component system, cell cycle response regulator
MNESGVDTWRTVPRRPRPATRRHPVLVHIYPSGPNLGSCYPLGEQALLIGRGSDCDICIPEGSVSRRHARIECRDDGYFVSDLQSTNGTYVNDVSFTAARLTDGDYLRVGGCIYRFLDGDNVEADYHEELYRLVVIDALTEVPNKRCFLEFLDRELARSARFDRPLALVLFDLDLFKNINDEAGHLAGDYTLRELARLVQTLVRREEMLARYGGEEFAIVLPETTREQAVVASERIRTVVAGHRFQFEGRSFSVTLSLGVAATRADPELTTAEFIRHADANLYEAKHRGRNRVVA